ncbi:MAG: DUF6323 family protein [bacterium]|nr:DUF6323 family protein [bacterium]
MSNLIMINDYNNLILSNEKLALEEILKLNELTSKQNLTLTREQAISLVNNRNYNLKEKGRIEVGSGILDKIIYEFYDSPYLDKESYAESLEELTNIFYQYQCDFDYKLTDEQIIRYMKKHFNNSCNGSTELLESIAFEELKNKLEKGDFYE